MTEVAEQEEIRIDVDLDNNMEWEVQTESADEYQENIYAGNTSDDHFYDKYDVPAARSYNKHLFVWVFSFVCGMYGVDRFCRGQVALGVFKILTFGGLGFWYLADLIIAIVKAYAADYRDMDDIMFDEYGRYIY